MCLTEIKTGGYMRYLAYLAAIVLGCGAVAGSANAAPPTNDQYAQAINIPESADWVFGTTAEATLQRSEPNFPTFPARNTVWWKFRAAQTGQIVISTFGVPAGRSSLGIGLDVFRGNSFAQANRIA